MMDRINEERKYFEENVLIDEEEIDKFYQKFKFKGNLGRGGFGFVIAGRYIEKDNMLVAIKIVPKSKDLSKTDYVRKEYKLLKKLQHDNIVNVVNVSPCCLIATP